MNIFVKHLVWCLLFLLASLTLQAQSCSFDKSWNQKGFTIEADSLQGDVYEKLNLKVKIKAPTKGKDIKKYDQVDCDGFVPWAANVLQVKITKIENLPLGVQWSSSVDENTFKPAEKGCVFLSGIPRKTGTFPIKIHLESKGKFLGISKTIKCTLTGYTLTINGQ